MKTVKKILFLLMMLVLTSTTNAQDSLLSSRTIKINGLSVGFAGAPQWPIGISYNQWINNKLQFEIGIGMLAVGASFNCYLTNPLTTKFNFYSGVSAMYNYQDGLPMLYLPVGIMYYSKKHFQYNFDLGLLLAENIKPIPSPWFGLKIGYHFGKNLESLAYIEKYEKRNSICVQLGGMDVILGIIYERFINSNIGAEFGLGLLGASVGIKYYLTAISDEKLNFYVGAKESIGFGGFKLYAPIGINFIANNNFRFSLDAGPQLWHENNKEVLPSFSLRIGKVF